MIPIRSYPTILNVQNDWAPILQEQCELPYFSSLMGFLRSEFEECVVYPKQEDIFQALRLTPYHRVKAVILGQDPYHGEGQAHGLSFSVRSGVTPPPSLRNIFKELQEDIGCGVPLNGDLSPWAKQGVLLLNTVLTVRENTPNSHKGKGWEQLTDRIIEVLDERELPIVFILWGKHAEEKLKLITRPHHLVIRSPHPSPFAARKGFFGSRPFSRANEFLRKSSGEEIDWRLPE